MGAKGTNEVRVDVLSGPTGEGTVEAVEIASARRGLARLKSLLGRDQMKALLKDEVDANDKLWSEWLRESDGEFAPARIVIRVSAPYGAEEFFGRWLAMMGDEPAMLAVSPEHFVFAYNEEGYVDLIENIGPYVTELHIDTRPGQTPYGETLDDHPVRTNCEVRLRDGQTVLHIHHQFKDVEGGFEGDLCVYFPKAMPEDVFEQHREHLVLEWTNWILAVHDRDPVGASA